MKSILFLCILTLTGCSLLPGTQTEIQDNAQVYEGSGFSMQVPKAWNVNTGVLLPTPKN
jgi:uncharacterized lipoprotein